MKLVKGSDLTTQQRQEVLDAYVHRWTHENAKQTYGGRCPACVQRRQCGVSNMSEDAWHGHHRPLISDKQWLSKYAFYITNAGHLSLRPYHCEPAYMADTKEDSCKS